MNYDPTDLVAQAEVKLAEETRRRAARETEADDYRWLMNSPQGRRLMWHWLGVGGLYRSPFNASGSVQSFNLGMHNFALMLNAAVVEHCPEKWLVMQQEAKPTS